MRGAVCALGLLCAGFQYAPLPDDNLVQNPWFRDNCQFSLGGWEVDVTADGLSWGLSDKPQDPTDVNCNGDWTGFAVRWAKQSGGTPELSPDQDARVWQVIGPVSPDETALRFHFLMVFHRMTRFRAQISGADGPSGPWTEIWTPIDEGWLTSGGPNAPFEGTCPGGLQDRDCLWDKVTEAELGGLAPLTFEAPRGYAYYRIEFLGNYPQPDASDTGDVGGKVTRVYFALGAGGAGSGGGGGGTTGAGGAGGDPGGSGGAPGSPGTPDEDVDESGGCACATAGESGGRGAGATGGLLLALSAVLRRARRRR